jgi:hypothetical protein
VLATIFEVDPLLANKDDLLSDEKLIAKARDQYAQDKAGPLTILPVSLCYVPLAHFVPTETLAALHTKANALTAFGADKKAILTQRLDGRAKLGQIEYIFDLGNWSPYFQGEDGKKYGTMLQILQVSHVYCPENTSKTLKSPLPSTPFQSDRSTSVPPAITPPRQSSSPLSIRSTTAASTGPWTCKS